MKDPPLSSGESCIVTGWGRLGDYNSDGYFYFTLWLAYLTAYIRFKKIVYLYCTNVLNESTSFKKITLSRHLKNIF